MGEVWPQTCKKIHYQIIFDGCYNYDNFYWGPIPSFDTYLLPTAKSFRTFWLTCTVLSICPVPASAKTMSASPKVKWIIHKTVNQPLKSLVIL